MKSLVWKELRQGRPLLVFSAVVALALCAASVIAAKPGRGGPAGSVTASFVFAGALIVLPQALGLLAAAGLFAAEADHGTLPVLFALPLSRARIWAAKAGAAAVLTAAALALLFGLTRLLAPDLVVTMRAMATWTDLGLLVAIAFSVGLFATVLTPNVVAAGIAAYTLALALFIGLYLLTQQCGALLLGYDDALDVMLWVALLAPALLFVSARAVMRGELLQWDRSVLLRFPLLLAGLLATIGLVSAVGRAATGYSRPQVRDLAAASSPSGGPAIALLAYNRPVPYQRAPAPARADTRPPRMSWQPRPLNQDDLSAMKLTSGPLYRNTSAVILDPKSGRELAVVREPFGTHVLRAAVSPGGRVAAVVTSSLGLTWGARQWPAPVPSLRIVDLKTGRRLYSGTPAPLKEHAGLEIADLAWSAGGTCLAFTTGAGGFGRSGSEVHLIGRDGAPRQEVEVQAGEHPWAWSPAEDVLYLTTADGLASLRPGERKAEPVWQVTDPAAAGSFSLLPSGISPKGDRIALMESQRDYVGGTSQFALIVVSRDGRRAQTIWRDNGSPTVSAAWSADAETLCVLTSTPTPRLLRWRPGEAQATELVVPDRLSPGYAEATLTPLPRGGLLLYPKRQYAQQQGTMLEVPLPAAAGPAIVDEAGALHPFPSASRSRAFADENIFVTVDEEGRLITLHGSPGRRTVVATDLRSSEQTRVYP
jgi:hypothetical protein